MESSKLVGWYRMTVEGMHACCRLVTAQHNLQALLLETLKGMRL